MALDLIDRVPVIYYTMPPIVYGQNGDKSKRRVRQVRYVTLPTCHLRTVHPGSGYTSVRTCRINTAYITKVNSNVTICPLRQFHVNSLVYRVWSSTGVGPLWTHPLPSVYTADLVYLVKSYDLNAHLYADDTQIYWFSHAASYYRRTSEPCVSVHF